jgi:hypothetical protein
MWRARAETSGTTINVAGMTIVVLQLAAAHGIWRSPPEGDFNASLSRTERRASRRTSRLLQGAQLRPRSEADALPLSPAVAHGFQVHE